MAIRTVLVLSIVSAAPLAAAPAMASGGGGCGAPVTSGTGVTVAIRQFCFTPTVVHAQTGQAITWVNRDKVSHSVGGANMVWGSFEELFRGDSIAYRFDAPGVYPYVCSWHPGMVGAVVVGNPGRTIEGELDASSISRASPVPAQAAPPQAAPAAETAGSATVWKIVGVASLGLLLLVVVAASELRRNAGT